MQSPHANTQNSLFHIMPHSLLHCFFILTLCFVHFGLHFLDFQSLAQNPQNFFDGSLILTSFDAYHYAKGAREFLESTIFSSLKNLDSLHPLAILGGICAHFVGLENMMCFGSVFLGFFTILALYFLTHLLLESLISGAFPSSLLAFLSFLSSLIGLSLPSFYQRVGAGYFDTDMLLLAFPLLFCAFLILFLERERFTALVLLGIAGYCAISWHNGIQSLLLLGFCLFVITEFLFAIKTRKIPQQSRALFCVLCIILTPSKLCPFALILFLLLFRFFPKALWTLCALSLIYSLCFGLFEPLFAQVQAYFFGATQHAHSFVFHSVVPTILETMPISLRTLINRSGGIFIFTLGILGFLLFCIFCLCILFFGLKTDTRWRPSFLYAFFFLLPFCILGFASLKIGARFNLFLMPIIALGFGILSLWAFAKFKPKNSLLCFLSVCIAGFMGTLKYQIPQPILSQEEINAFVELDDRLSKEDFIFSWWDYGYALRYFTKAQVFLDGGRHSGAANYPIAKILLSDSPILFYNFSALLAKTLQALPQNSWSQAFESLFLQTKFENVESFLHSLSTEIKPNILSNNAQIYWVLPFRILPLLANLNTFANLNPKNGKPLKESFFAFLESPKTPQFTHKKDIVFYKNFYISTNSQKDSALTQIYLGRNSLMLSNDYLNSNIIQMLLFQNNPPMTIANGELVRIYQLKEL